MTDTNTSEVVQIRQQIVLEYEAANRVFTDFTATGTHAFITKRQENIESCFISLQKYMTPEEAMKVLVEVEHEVYSVSASSGNTS